MLQTVKVLPDEEFTELCIYDWEVLQKKQGFRFSSDPVLLAHFIHPKGPGRLLDFGTGCGVIPFLLAARYPELQLEGVELQTEIADMAVRSVRHCSLENRITIHNADITDLPSDFFHRYDWITSNPPFFKAGSCVPNSNPQIALSRHEIACSLEQLITAASLCLTEHGHFAMIHRAERLPEILAVCTDHQLTPSRMRFIHAKKDQAAHLVLLECIHHRKCGLSVLPPLIQFNDDNTYSEEMHTYYIPME